MADDYVPLDVTPIAQQPASTGLQRVYVTGDIPADLVPLDITPGTAFVPPTKDAETKPLSPMERINDTVNLLGTAATNAPMNLAGLPGTLNRIAQQQEKEEPNRDLFMPGDVGAMVDSSALFHEVVGKHLPSGEEIKNWFWGPNGLGGKLGIPRREPQKDNVSEKVMAGAAEAAATPFAGPARALGAAAGGLGAFAEQIYPDHPILANFLAQTLALVGGGALVKSARVAGDAAPKTVREAMGGTPEERVGRTLISQAGLSKDELANRLMFNDRELVPGSKPTFAQAVDSPGAVSMENNLRANDPAFANDLQARQLEQAAAQRSVAEGIAPTGDVSLPGQRIQAMNDTVAANIAQRQKEAAQEIERRLAALGPEADPSVVNNTIKEVISNSYKDARDRVKSAYQSIIEPGRSEKIGIDPGPATRRVDKVLRDRFGRMNPAPKELTALRDSIENEKNALTFKDMNDLLARTETLVQKFSKDRNAQATALAIKDILLQRMDASASSVLKLPQPLQQFSKEQEARTIAERLTRLNELRDIEGMAPLKRWGASRKELEARIKNTEIRMRDEFGVGGAMNPDEYNRFIHAREMRKAMGDAYESGAMKDVLARGSEVGGTKLTNSEVASRFWHGDVRSNKEDMDQFIRTVGDKHAATTALRDYAVGNLRALAAKHGGELTQPVLTKYLADHAGPLNTAIGAPIKRELQNLTTAREALAADIERSSSLLSDFQKSAARHFLVKNGGPADPSVAISKALSPANKTGTEDMRQLAKIARGDASGDTLEGLKALVRDDFLAKTTKDGFIDGPAAKKWMDANGEKIRPVLGQTHVENLQKIVDDVTRITSGPGGKPAAAAKVLFDGLNGKFALLDRIPGAQWLHLRDILMKGDKELVQDLYHEAMLNPALAKTLVEKVTPSNANTIGAKILGFLKLSSRNINQAVLKDHGVASRISGPMTAAAINSPSHPEPDNGQ